MAYRADSIKGLDIRIKDLVSTLGITRSSLTNLGFIMDRELNAIRGRLIEIGKELSELRPKVVTKVEGTDPGFNITPRVGTQLDVVGTSGPVGKYTQEVPRKTN